MKRYRIYINNKHDDNLHTILTDMKIYDQVLYRAQRSWTISYLIDLTDEDLIYLKLKISSASIKIYTD